MQPPAIADLQRSGISEAEAEQAGMFYVESAAALFPEFRAEPAIVIPYFDTGKVLMRFERAGKLHPFCRVRYLGDAPAHTFGKRKSKPKYGQPKHSGVRAYFSPLLDWKPLIDDTEAPLIITEGEKKATAGAVAGLPVIALGGVYNFMDTVDELLSELARLRWRGRTAYIVFDSDAANNPHILAAEARLVDELQRKRGAKCVIVRLPQDGDAKVGLDDWLLVHGAEGLIALMRNAPSLGALDAKVVSLNKTCAWIEQEGMVYDMEENQFIKKDNFVNGSRYSALEHITTGGAQRSAPKRISVAATWLKHPHAQRYGEILFRPGEGSVVKSENGRPALNMWAGWNSESATADDPRIAAWLQLTRYLFQNLRPQDQDLPIKLLAYKAQHPEQKVPLAFVLIGPQGCGKTLWGETVRDAMSPYGVDITPGSLAGEFQGWLERSIFGLINEAAGEDMLRASEQLKALVSDLTRPMNEKFRPIRQIRTYTLYCITSNNRAVGAFAADDRRMIVVDCPQKLTTDDGVVLYSYLGRRDGRWYPDNGPKALLGYLLDYDLEGWTPPAAAPPTAEKHMAYTESLTPVQHLADAMKTADQNVVKLWLDSAQSWAASNEASSNHSLAAMARATLSSVPRFQVRPFYTPQELALLFPDIIANLQGVKFARTTSSGQISRELRDAGVPYLTNRDDTRGFMYRGTIQQFLVVAQFDEWRKPLSQAEFDRIMQQCPTYAQLAGTKIRRA